MLPWSKKAIHPSEIPCHHGHGRCLRCRGPWCAVTEKVTPYGSGRGCFPLCESCWIALGTPEARLPFYRVLWEQWVSYPEVARSDWADIQTAVEAGL